MPFRRWKVANALLAMVFNQLNGRRPLKEIGAWLDNTPMGRWMDVCGKDFTKDILFSALDSVCTTDGEITTRRILAIQKLATEAWRKRLGRDPSRYYFYYDIARIRYHGSACPLANNGYGPVAKGRPHVGLGLVTSRGNYFPILSMAVNGSTSDARTFDDMAARLEAWNLKLVTLVMDRGIMNADNTAYARRTGFDVLGGCTETSDEVKAALRKWRDEDLDRSTQVYLRPEMANCTSGHGRESCSDSGEAGVDAGPRRRTKERGTRDRMPYELRHGAKKKRAKKLRKRWGMWSFLRRGDGDGASTNRPRAR
jgi:hypothetical protein